MMKHSKTRKKGLSIFGINGFVLQRVKSRVNAISFDDSLCVLSLIDDDYCYRMSAFPTCFGDWKQEVLLSIQNRPGQAEANIQTIKINRKVEGNENGKSAEPR